MSKTKVVTEVDPLDEEFKDPRDTGAPPRDESGLRSAGGMQLDRRGAERIADGLLYASIYWMYGNSPKGSATSEVSDPPCSGWSHCFVVDPDPEAPLVTLFCPYTFGAWRVSRQSYEYRGLRGAGEVYEWRLRGHFTERLPRVWAELRRRMVEARYDVAAMVMRALELPVPKDEDLEDFQPKVTGGKEPEKGAGLTKPVKRDGRRGEVLAFFLEHEGCAASIHSATAKFGITRSNLLSQLFLLRKEHGIGYAVQGDTATITLPNDCKDPFV